MNTTILLVGKTTDPHIETLCQEYLKRLTHYLPVRVQVIPELRNTKALTPEQQKQAAGELKELLAKEDASVDDIKAKMDALQEVVFAVTSKMYQKIQEEQQAAQGEGCSGDCGSCGNDDNVVDADYEVKKD